MTKTQLIDLLAAKLSSTKTDCGKFLDGLASVVAEAIAKGEEVVLPGIAKITVKEVPAKPAKQKINPFTKQMITVAAKPASKKVKAKPLAALKKAAG